MEEKSIMYYKSSHNILLVGEGDFSFSLCLARKFGTAVNMVATSLDDRGSLVRKYSSALRNLTELEGLGCTIVHEVDVHHLTEYSTFKFKKFDRIIFNFPHAGFTYGEHDARQIELHKALVGGFLKNAKYLVSFFGQIHITHKTAHPFSNWNIKKLAKDESLEFDEEVKFYQWCYPGYNNKRGSGLQCDQSFPVGMSSTFKFSRPLIFDFDKYLSL